MAAAPRTVRTDDSGQRRGVASGRGPDPDRSSSAEDWPRVATDLVVEAVDTLRAATTARILWAVRIVVYGTVAAVVSLVLLATCLIAAVRIAEIAARELLPDPLDGIWFAYVLVGSLSMLLGAAAWRRRSAQEEGA
ncbi:MAG: hypothetical protein KatS3mg008_1422 [Acidimicrobiales bacterium]|nr:MAG: hypothetical protein KatS3mg008_1422 [Acidimicrobiales bacterium]